MLPLIWAYILKLILKVFKTISVVILTFARVVKVIGDLPSVIRHPQVKDKKKKCVQFTLHVLSSNLNVRGFLKVPK